MSEPDEDDEYETEEQAAERIGVIRQANGVIALTLPVEPDAEAITEYAAFNQAEYFEPLFASGEIHSGLRHMLDDPLFTSNNLRSATRFADMRNGERALDDKMGKYGPVVVRTRTIIQTPWTDVPYEQLDQARGR